MVQRRGSNSLLLLSVATLVLVGLATLYSAGQTDVPSAAAEIWRRQIVWLGLGIVIDLFGSYLALSTLGIGIAALVNVLDPNMVVVGGGVTEHIREWLMPVVRAVVPRRTVGRLYRIAPEIVVAHLGDRAGMIGAADMARIRSHPTD